MNWLIDDKFAKNILKTQITFLDITLHSMCFEYSSKFSKLILFDQQQVFLTPN